MYDGADLTVAELTRYHVKWLIYAMTNNMAGSGRDAPTSQAIYRYLKDSVMILLSGKPVASPLRRMLLSMPSIKLMAEAFLRSALEVGDSRAVETLLQFLDLGIRVNDLSIAVNGRTYTAVERATLLQHLQMTMLLVAHGADVDKTYRKPSGSTRLRHCSQATEHSYNLCSMMGAAANAIQGHDRSSTLGYSLVDSLLRHGAGVDPLALAKVITTKDIAMIEILLHGGLQHQLFEWTQARFLHAAFFALPPASLVKVIVQLQLYGFDFTEARYDCAPHIRWYYQTKDLPPRLIDVVALRGEREIVCMLLSHGSPITPDTVVAAVLSGNADLVEFLLRQKQFANAFSNHFYTTPLAEAVRSQHPILLPMLVGLVELHHIEPNPGIALLAAATEAGDIGLLRKLLSCHCPFSATSMGYAISKATLANQTESTTMLLEAGAEVDFQRIYTLDPCVFNICERPASSFQRPSLPKEMIPLRAAIIHRNKTLIWKLLDHNVSRAGALAAAVEWGDHAIISDLLSVPTIHCTAYIDDEETSTRVYVENGIIDDEDEAIAAAVRAQDLVLLRLVLTNCLGSQATFGIDTAINRGRQAGRNANAGRAPVRFACEFEKCTE
ncbi:unnamed protein product [Zymoseptoria tritici ST99CH_3D7]|uniref:Uncharacterized protein n=1 Tax=Zymoseptoria tritici (strain ST99CH_3D7) TaxID=1276538 RepID=A0A1X7S957_ZYMT9|nr:unnamed protein product [Zymoseptoria tritici ST99CH_3D7]